MKKHRFITRFVLENPSPGPQWTEEKNDLSSSHPVIPKPKAKKKISATATEKVVLTEENTITYDVSKRCLCLIFFVFCNFGIKWNAVSDRTTLQLQESL